MERLEMHTKYRSGNLMGRDYAEDLDVDGKIISELILRKWVGRCGLGSSGSGYGRVAGSCGHGNETSGSIQAGNFLTGRMT
jgi:hypothetical protein